MKLSEIAETLKHDAFAHPGEMQSYPLGHGAECNLRAEFLAPTEVEWHLQIRRAGNLSAEDTPAHKRWLAELATFGKPEYFNIPSGCKPKMQRGKHSYAAVFVWTESVEPPDVQTATIAKRAPSAVYIKPIPQTDDEIAAWARTLGRGVKITGVNVFTGEL